MNKEYNWGREDLKKELYNKRKRFNIICFIVIMVIYILYIWQAIKMNTFDNKWLLVLGLLFISLVLAILHYSAKLYVFINLRRNDKKTKKAYGKYIVNATEDTISVSVNDQNITYKYSDINKFRMKKDMFFISTSSDKLGLTFKKSMLGEEDYNQLLNIVKKNINK